jgi:RHS repeat-associated protein
VTYSYDAEDRPVAASSAANYFVTAASYLPFGPLSSLTYGNGTTKTMAYDSRYRPSENKLTTATSVIADYVYQNDAVGNITQIHDAVALTYNRDFGYDDLNRLTTANSGTSLWGTGSYGYDAMGNMTSLHLGSRSLTFAYNGTTPRLTSVSGSAPATVSYDAAGNESSLGTYSPRNLLSVVGDPSPESSHVAFSYDGRGVRVLASSSTPGIPPWGGTTNRRSLYSPELHLIAQSDWAYYFMDGWFTGTEYIWFGDQPVAQTFTDPTIPTRYTFTDHLGTPILQTSPSASIAWRAEYEPYGRIYAYRTGDSTDPQALRLPGQEIAEYSDDSAYNIFRWYTSAWGRYTQGDPVKIPRQPFAYGSDDPIGMLDPLGLSTVNFGPVTTNPTDINDVYIQCQVGIGGGLKGCTRLTHLKFNCSCNGCTAGYRRKISLTADSTDVFYATNASTDNFLPHGTVPPGAILSEEMKHVADFSDARQKLKDTYDVLEEATYSDRRSCERGCLAAHSWTLDYLQDRVRHVDASHPSYYAH